MRRKLFAAALFFMGGIACAHLLPEAAPLLILSLLPLLFLPSGRKRALFPFLYCMALIFCLGCARLFIAETSAVRAGLASYEGRPHTCRGVVEKVEKSRGNKYRIYCSVKGIRVLCLYNGKINDPGFLIGREIIFTLRLKRANKNPGKAFYVSHIYGFQSGRASPSLKIKFSRYVLKKRARFLDTFEENTDRKALLRGMLFGGSAGPGADLRGEFSKNGTAHILAVSGLHIGILYSVYRRLTRRVKSKLPAFAFLCLLLCYGTAAEWSVSVTRAVILVLLITFGDMAERRYDILTALSFASAAILLWNPYMLFDAGFQMSFLAAASIAFLVPVLEPSLGVRLSVPIAAQAGLAPYIAFVFGRFSLVGIIANIPVVFLASVIVPLGVGAFFLYFLSGIVIPPLNILILRFSGLLIYVNHFFSEIRFFSCEVGKFPLFLLLSFYAAVFFTASELFKVYYLRGKYIELLEIGCALLLISFIASVRL